MFMHIKVKQKPIHSNLKHKQSKHSPVPSCWKKSAAAEVSGSMSGHITL